jgi:hypothetical protein
MLTFGRAYGKTECFKSLSTDVSEVSDKIDLEKSEFMEDT